MNKVVVNIKIDPETKAAAQALANDLGLALSASINAHLKQLINQRRLVLDAPHPVMPVNAETEKALDDVYEEVKAGQVSKPFDNVDDFLKDLKA